MAANRILLVEDDHAIADAVALNLHTVGYEVVFFDDGGIAADSLKTDHSYDLALLDIMLPGMDGFELFARMEKYNIPVIYMTARTDSESEVRGLRDGAEDYIVKPFAIVTLLVRIEKVLARTGRLNQVYRYRDFTLDVISETSGLLTYALQICEKSWGCQKKSAPSPKPDTAWRRHGNEAPEKGFTAVQPGSGACSRRLLGNSDRPGRR